MHLFKPPFSLSLPLCTLALALANIKEILELTLKKYLHCVAAWATVALFASKRVGQRKLIKV